MVPGESRCSSAGEPGGRTSLRASSPFDEDDLSDASTLRVTCRALLTGHAEDVQEILSPDPSSAAYVMGNEPFLRKRVLPLFVP